MHILTLPRKLISSSVCSYFSNELERVKKCRPTRILFDFNGLEFIDPSGVVTLWNMVELFESKYECQINYSTPRDYIAKPRSFKAIDYLDDSLFFQKVMGKKLHPFSAERSTTNGLEKLKSGYFNSAYIDRTIHWLQQSVSLQSHSFSFLGTALSELFNNINDHSQSPVGGCAFAQHYPSNKEITLCISDAGRGIPNSMREKYTVDHTGKKLDKDCLLIDYATNHKISTRSKPNNAGLGLENLLGIMKSNKGTIKILSNNGVLEYNYSGDIPKKKLYTPDGHYSGTLVLMTFRTDTLESEEEEDLEWY